MTPRASSDQNREQIANLALLDEGMTQWKLRYDLVLVAPALSLTQHIALLDQLGEDPVSGALGDPHRSGDVAQANPRIMSDADQDMSVVGQKVPAGAAVELESCAHRSRY